jgi:hypothetical protein
MPQDQGSLFASDTAREVDENNFITIRENPISMEGVFPYLGRTIGPECEPDKIYMVYRPASELADPECVDSFKMLPLVDEHAMLGSEDDGFLPAEKKGVHGTSGEAVAFRDGFLYATIKVFSTKLAELIESGKNQLSIGYRCRYTKEPGTFRGQVYDFIQRTLRGNHIAIVEEGRCGPDVAVLDHRITFDHLDLKLKQEDTKMPITLDELDTKLNALTGLVTKLTSTMDAKAKDEDEKKKEKEAEDEDKDDKKDKKAEDADEEKEDKKKAEDKEMCEDEDEDKEDKKKKEGMDAAIKKLQSELTSVKKGAFKAVMGEVSKRNALAEKLSQHVGAFDHAEMTLDEVAAYGVKKLELPCEAGTEQATLNGFLHARPNPSSATTHSFDAKPKSGRNVDEFYKQTA